MSFSRVCLFAEQNRHTVLYQGWLWKKPLSFTISNQWTRRYFVLSPLYFDYWLDDSQWVVSLLPLSLRCVVGSVCVFVYVYLEC